MADTPPLLGAYAAKQCPVRLFRLHDPTETAVAVAMDARVKAKMQGYEGEACGDCGNYTLVRNGTCMKCNTCGGTSGCS